MESHELKEHEKELFKHVSECNISEVKQLINDFKVSVNCYDDQGMTPLQHAAFKGNYEICKLLLDCGADVNGNQHIYGYSALCLAALSNHCDVVALLLDHGANISAKNSNKRTASEMAAFVGNHKAVSVINNYVSKDLIDYFTEIHGFEQEPKLPAYLSVPVHKLIITSNIHPVRLVLYLQSNSIILQNAKKVINVLNILAEKQLKEFSNERLSIKCHHIAFVLSSAFEYINTQKAKSSEEISEQKILDSLIKTWLKGPDDSGISLTLEKLLRKSISAYPFLECLLLQHIVSTISMTTLGSEPNALTVLCNAIIGQHSFGAVESCSTCGEQVSGKKCSGCKNVQYCDKTCQKLHWFIHKNMCKKD